MWKPCDSSVLTLNWVQKKVHRLCTCTPTSMPFYKRCLTQNVSKIVERQNGCAQVFPGRQPYQQEGASLLRPDSIAATFLHIQTWHAKYPTSGQHHALEFNVRYAGVPGIAFNLSTLYHRWNAYTNWSPSITQTDLLEMHDKREVVSSTLRAMGLDYHRLPTHCNPEYRHTVPTGQDATAIQRAARMQAIMSGDAPLQLHPSQSQATSAQLAGASSMSAAQPAATAAPSATGYAPSSQSTGLMQTDRVYATSLLVNKLQTIEPPADALIRSVAMLADNYAFGPDNGIVTRSAHQRWRRIHFTSLPLRHPSPLSQNSHRSGLPLIAKSSQTMRLLVARTTSSLAL